MKEFFMNIVKIIRSKYLRDVVRYFKGKVMILWFLEILDIIYDSIEPLLIGLAIDDLLTGKCFWLWGLSVSCFVDIIVNYVRNVSDDKVYNSIKLQFRQQYYETALKKDLTTDILDADIDLVDEPVDFIRYMLTDYLNPIVNMLFSICFIFIKFSIRLKIFVVIISIISLFRALKFNNKRMPYIFKLHDLWTTRRKEIGSRNSNRYKIFQSTEYVLLNERETINSNSILFISLIGGVLLIGSLCFFAKEPNVNIGMMYAGLQYITTFIYSFEIFYELQYECANVLSCIDKIDF